MAKVASQTKLIGFISIIIFFVIWQIIASSGVMDAAFIGTPSEIFKEGMYLIKSGEFYKNLGQSVASFSTGFLLAVIIGTLGGVAIGSNKKVYYFLRPYIFALNTIPPIVLLPLVIIWFGIGFTAKSAIVFLMSVIPIIVNTIDGAHSVNPQLLMMASSFNPRRLFIIKTITFYSALPNVFTGVRLAVGRAIVGVIIAEFFGFGEGIGYLISYYSSSFMIDRAMFLLFSLVVLNFLLLSIIGQIEKRVAGWSKA